MFYLKVSNLVHIFKLAYSGISQLSADFTLDAAYYCMANSLHFQLSK